MEQKNGDGVEFARFYSRNNFEVTKATRRYFK